MSDTTTQEKDPDTTSTANTKIVTLIVAIPSILTILFGGYMAVRPFVGPPDIDRSLRSTYDLEELRGWADGLFKSKALPATSGDLAVESWPKNLPEGSVKKVFVDRDKSTVHITLAVEEFPDTTVCLDPIQRQRMGRYWFELASGVWRVYERDQDQTSGQAPGQTDTNQTPRQEPRASE